MASKGHPNPVDVHVGGRIRLRRTLLGLSQEALADSLGLTFQQVQKYERGSNRVSSSRLFDLVLILSVPIAYFFDEMGSESLALPEALAELCSRYRLHHLAPYSQGRSYALTFRPNIADIDAISDADPHIQSAGRVLAQSGRAAIPGSDAERLEEFSLSLHPVKTRLFEFGRRAAIQCAQR